MIYAHVVREKNIRSVMEKMAKKEPKFAPQEIFEKILEWSVVPTFDLVIQYGKRGFIVVRRKIAPYNNQWALPGLRMLKGEEIDDVLERIAKKELGLSIEPKKKIFLGQYVGKFKTEYQRQDLSTGYMVSVQNNQVIQPNLEHFKDYNVTKEIPSPIGAMYKFYLEASKKL